MSSFSLIALVMRGAFGPFLPAKVPAKALLSSAAVGTGEAAPEAEEEEEGWEEVEGARYEPVTDER